jgi:hypothetical protein
MLLLLREISFLHVWLPISPVHTKPSGWFSRIPSVSKGDDSAGRHGVYDEGSDPEKRRRHIIARDCQLVRYVRQQAEELHLSIYEVDGSRSREEMTVLVERHFDPYLIECFKQLR